METSLHAAILNEKIKIIHDLIKKRVDVNSKTTSGESPLHLAIHKKNASILKILIEAGADVNIKNDRERTPLHEVLKLEYGNERNAMGGSINKSMPYLDVDVLKHLLEAGADVNAVCTDSAVRNTPLHMALASPKHVTIDILKLLVNAGADVNAKDSFDRSTPLFLALCVSDNLDILKLLVEAGADVNARDKYESTVLHCTTDYPTLKFLLDAGSEVDAKDEFGYTPLHCAVGNLCNVNILKLFIKFGADINAKSMMEKTPLHLALLYTSLETTKDLDSLKFLLESGAKINARNVEGNTPLLYACESGGVSVNILEILFEAGADLNERNHEGETGITLFIKSQLFNFTGDEDLIKEVLEWMIQFSDVNPVDAEGTNFLANILESGYLILYRRHFFEIILKHIAKLKVLKYHIHPSLLSIISGNYKYNKYFITCTEELERAKSTKLHNCWVSFFNLLVDDKSKLMKYAGNKYLVNDFIKNAKNFPIYSFTIFNNLSEGIEARELFDGAASTLSHYCPIFDPYHLIIRSIIEILTQDDWKNLNEKKRSLLCE